MCGTSYIRNRPEVALTREFLTRFDELRKKIYVSSSLENAEGYIDSCSCVVPISSQTARGAKAKKATQRSYFFLLLVAHSSGTSSSLSSQAFVAGKDPQQQPKRNLFSLSSFAFSLRSLQPDILAISRSRKQKKAVRGHIGNKARLK